MALQIIGGARVLNKSVWGGGYPGGTGKMVRSFLAIKTAAIEIATGLVSLCDPSPGLVG